MTPFSAEREREASRGDERRCDERSADLRRIGGGSATGSAAYHRRIGARSAAYPWPGRDVPGRTHGHFMTERPGKKDSCRLVTHHVAGEGETVMSRIQRGRAADMTLPCCRSSADAPQIQHRSHCRCDVPAGLAVTRFHVCFRSRSGPLATEAEQASATSRYLSSGAEDACDQTERWSVMSLSAASLPAEHRRRRCEASIGPPRLGAREAARPWLE